jgi:hypothetical protein
MKHPRLIDISGVKFGEWTAICKNGNSKGGGAFWDCLCSCGKRGTVLGGDLRAGKSKSCGHDKKERAAKLNKTHGESGTRLYEIWKNMHRRCKDKNNKRYGARSIQVCANWHSYQEFHQWAITNGYSDFLTIDRIDNNKGYFPENCRWSTAQQQSENREFVARRQDGALWWHVAQKNGISQGAYRTRLYAGWSYEDASTLPMHKKRIGHDGARDKYGKFTSPQTR